MSQYRKIDGILEGDIAGDIGGTAEQARKWREEAEECRDLAQAKLIEYDEWCLRAELFDRQARRVEAAAKQESSAARAGRGPGGAGC